MSEGRFKPWELDRLTLPLLMCLAYKEPPGGEVKKTYADMKAYLDERKNAEMAWSAPE